MCRERARGGAGAPSGDGKGGEDGGPETGAGRGADGARRSGEARAGDPGRSGPPVTRAAVSWHIRYARFGVSSPLLRSAAGERLPYDRPGPRRCAGSRRIRPKGEQAI
ncbi:hypothetical protein GCM10009605_33640 [Nocardiopsis composta]